MLVARAIRILTSLALIGVGGCNKPELPNYVRLQITTADLPEAKLGLNYDHALIAAGGQPPIVWSLSAKPASLGWLTIDSATGKLTGVPTARVSPGESFLVRAVDARGETAEKTMTLQALECIGNEQGNCYRFDTTAQQCQQSSVICSNGRFPDCGTGPVSTDPKFCGPPSTSGPGCGSCGTSGDACDGVCRCGLGAACFGANPDCCSGGCTNLDTSTQHCGSCGNVCPISTRQFGVVACVGGKCIEQCVSGYTDCNGSCVDTLNDPSNCGSCGKVCSNDFCDSGSCCGPGSRYCPTAGCVSIKDPCP